MLERTTIMGGTDLYRLALGCLYVNLGKAVLDFPGSTRAHPSLKVTVSRAFGEPLRDGDKQYFPFQVVWHIWESVVVPVLQDPAYQVITRETSSLRITGNQAFIESGDYEALLQHIQRGLIVQMQEVGILPPEDAALPGDVPGAGEPIIRGSEDPLLVDPEILWPEGHRRLTYPEVDGGATA